MTVRNNLLMEFGKMPLRRRVAVCSRIGLALFFLVAGLIKLNYF